MIVRFSFLVLIFYLKKLRDNYVISIRIIPVEKLITRERCDQEFNTLELNLYKS